LEDVRPALAGSARGFARITCLDEAALLLDRRRQAPALALLPLVVALAPVFIALAPRLLHAPLALGFACVGFSLFVSAVVALHKRVGHQLVGVRIAAADVADGVVLALDDALLGFDLEAVALVLRLASRVQLPGEAVVLEEELRAAEEYAAGENEG